MNEILFPVEEAPEGGFAARALGVAIFTEARRAETMRRSGVIPFRYLKRSRSVARTMVG
ncbi:MAG: hypothetical protein M5U32_14445 [Myxococcota bacterium]|nr:hypothetical protein [Myxococcota bacterium]